MFLFYYSTRSFYLIQVADWFYRNTAIYGLLCEPIIKNALLDDQRPTPEFPFRRFFPSYIDKSTAPEPLPRDVDEPVGPIFQKNGINHHQLFQVVKEGIHNVMRLEARERAAFRYDDLMYFRFIVTTAVPWGRGSQNRNRDWWSVPAGAFLESLAMPRYRTILLATAVGYARLDLEEIILTCIDGQYVDVPGSSDMEIVKIWRWVDMIPVPKDLPSREEFLKVDPEIEFRKLIESLKTRRDIQAILNVLFRAECSKTYRDEIIDLNTVQVSKKASSSRGEKVNFEGPIVKRKPFLDSDVFDKAQALVLVRSHFISILHVYSN